MFSSFMYTGFASWVGNCWPHNVYQKRVRFTAKILGAFHTDTRNKVHPLILW